MGKSQNWFGVIRRKLFRYSHHETVIVLHANNTTTTTSFTEDATATEDAVNREITKSEAAFSSPSSSPTPKKELLSDEDIAAMKIQASFRAHLARKAFRALKSLVKVQAVVRGAYARKQARMALHCMHALAQLQVTVRARQLLSRCSDN
ncbi:protein IQ-DOMAIN 20-like [Cornus florida]|uniref:protein IQ-DOMAIN 20-like n=1 Tax=Cornus florida TaxID=4283 RepID=UPI00289C77F2|nr:protein IQ-DOMAIN 20-like [Cornus florida]